MSWRRDSTLSGGSSMHVLHYIHTTLYAYTPLFLMTNVSMSIVIIVFPMQVDLVGGYYDAGDNVKFGFPMAFTTTMLSWSVIEFGGVMKDELQNAREAIRWATDYLLKATAYPDTIYVQVGDAEC
jgi:hypothetical protein